MRILSNQRKPKWWLKLGMWLAKKVCSWVGCTPVPKDPFVIGANGRYICTTDIDNTADIDNIKITTAGGSWEYQLNEGKGTEVS